MYVVHVEYLPLHYDIDTGEPIPYEKWVQFDTRKDAEVHANMLTTMLDVFKVRLFKCQQLSIK